MPKGPLLLTSVKPEQFSPEYWIRRLSNPDRPLKTPEELQKMNENIHLAIKDCMDVFKMDLKKSGKSVRDQLELEYRVLKGRVLWGVDDARIPASIFEHDIKPLVQLEVVPDKIRIRWGAATQATSVRALPSDVKVLEKQGDIEFDQLQFTLIKLWTPVGVLHESADGQWFYIQAPYTRGWVKSRDIALFKTRDALKKMVKSPDFLVVTGESIPIFSTPELQHASQRPSMGTILPLAGKNENGFEIWMPHRESDSTVSIRKAYLGPKSDVTEGFLPYTQGNIIRQAFKLLGARYGWGGTYNGRDCSAFTHDIFLSLGIEMPRGSKDQTFAGTQINHFEPYEDDEGKIAAIRSATPGATLLRMPHHQMLYLGEENGNFYAIHCTWAERISMTSDEKNRINQVVVSDLTLNGNSYLGSLFDRIISVSEVQ